MQLFSMHTCTHMSRTLCNILTYACIAAVRGRDSLHSKKQPRGRCSIHTCTHVTLLCTTYSHMDAAVRGRDSLQCGHLWRYVQAAHKGHKTLRCVGSVCSSIQTYIVDLYIYILDLYIYIVDLYIYIVDLYIYIIIYTFISH
jgi:hypothetical protein